MLCALPSRRPFPLQTALSHAVYPSSGNQSRESQNSHWLLSKEKEASGSVLCLLEGKLLGNHYSNIEHHPKTFCYQCGVDKTLERLLFLGSKDPKSETWCFPRNEGALQLTCDSTITSVTKPQVHLEVTGRTMNFLLDSGAHNSALTSYTGQLVSAS